MILLRPYQSDIIERVRVSLASGVRRVLIQLSTGGGKTAIASFIANSARQKNKTVWFLAHRDFLLDQTAQTFDSVGVTYGFIAAGRAYNPHHAVHIVSVGTARQRLDRLVPPDLMIWDEVKHIAAASWAAIFKWAPHAIHLGLDATPWRLDGRGLGDYFDEMISGPSVSALMADGYLSQYRAFAPSAPDLAGVHTIAGDYSRGELGGVMDDGQIIGDMVRHYRERADGKRAIYFCVSVEHSKHVAARFEECGIPARHLDATSSSDVRRRAAIDFAENRCQVLANVDLFGEGYDLSSQAGSDATVECVGLARPTKSLSLHLQQVGRALRPKSVPAIILDHAGNLLRHGLPDDERQWSLKGIDRRTKAAREGPAVTQCGSCYGVHRAGLLACPYCGTGRVLQAREVEEVAGNLVEISHRVAERERANQYAREKYARDKAEQSEATTLADLIQLGRKRGFKNPSWWAINVMKGREKYG